MDLRQLLISATDCVTVFDRLSLLRSWKQAEASTPTSLSSGQAATGESNTFGTAQAGDILRGFGVGIQLIAHSCFVLAGIPVRASCGLGNFTELKDLKGQTALPALPRMFTLSTCIAFQCLLFCHACFCFAQMLRSFNACSMPLPTSGLQ